MTIEELRDYVEILHSQDEISYDVYSELIDGIDTLEQETCEDCISRQAVLDGIADLKKSPWFNDDTNGAKIIRKEAVEIVEKLCVKQLPSVKPQPKTGHWISHYDEDAKEGWYECDRCHTERAFNTDYCPDCGAKMQEVAK